MVLIIKERPFKSRLFTALVLTNELTYLLILGTYLVYYFISDNINLNSRYNYVGSSLIGLILLNILFNCVVGIFQVVYWIFGMCRSKKSLETIQEENDELYAFRKITPDKPTTPNSAGSPRLLQIEPQLELGKKGIKQMRRNRGSSKAKNSVRQPSKDSPVQPILDGFEESDAEKMVPS